MNTLTFNVTVNADHLLHLPDELPVGLPLKITIEPLTGDGLANHYPPRTEIGRLALAARKAYIESGGKLLSAEEISAEVSRRRGGVSDE